MLLYVSCKEFMSQKPTSGAWEIHSYKGIGVCPLL